MDLWVQYFEGYPKRNSNGSYDWPQFVAHVVTIAAPERPSILLLRAGDKDCYKEIRIRKIYKHNVTSQKQGQNAANEKAQKKLLDNDSIDFK